MFMYMIYIHTYIQLYVCRGWNRRTEARRGEPSTELHRNDVEDPWGRSLSSSGRLKNPGPTEALF